MPEGDTVRLTASRLHHALAGRTLAGSDFRVPRHATADLAGARILSFTSYGKHLLCRFDTGLTLHSHLRMDGSWRVLAAGRELPRREAADIRVVLDSTKGIRAVGLRLPVVDLLATADEPLVIGHLGPDILAPDFDEAEAVRRLSAVPRRPVVEALLDQRNLAGIGNMWAGETLYLRGVSPWTSAGKVDLVGCVRLARRMMTFALRHPGQVTTGNSRRGQTHWVYGRTGEPCRRCGTPIEYRPAGAAATADPPPSTAGAAVGNGNVDPYQRDTWWCPHCQPR